MEEETYLEQIRVAVPIRIRGMSSQNRFFDERTETDWVGEENVTSHLRTLVDLDTEVHVANLNTNVGGTFRVVWTNTREVNGLHPIGLRLVEREGDLWAMDFPAPDAGEGSVIPQIWLECQRCHQRILSPVPEAQGEFLCEGFRVARHCEPCRSTTSWNFAVEPQPGAPPALEGGQDIPSDAGRTRRSPASKRREEQRTKGRAPLRMSIKVIRKKYGAPLEDICKTINVSRNGVYFLSNQNYDLGETLQVFLNYQEGDLALPVLAKVVRLDHPEGTFLKAIAVQLVK